MSFDAVNPHALAMFAVCSAILAAHLLLLGFWTGRVRISRKQYVNPEDAKISNGLAVEAAHADVLRVKRAHQNALENARAVLHRRLPLCPDSTQQAGLRHLLRHVHRGARASQRLLPMGQTAVPHHDVRIGMLATLGMATRVVLVSV